jgi:UPF0755 protein
MSDERKSMPDEAQATPGTPTTHEAPAGSPADAVPPPPEASPRPRWLRREKTPRPAKLTKQQKWSERAKHPFVVGGNAALSLLLIFMVCAAVVVEYGRQQFYGTGPLASEKVLVIPRGLGVRQIGDLLEEKGVIENKWTFVTGLQFMGSRGSLQAGEYAFPARASMNDVMKIIASGKVIEHPITVAEGLTSQQIVKRLAEFDVLTGDIRQIPPEGSLLPETYRVTRGTTREQILNRMTQARDKALNEAWENRDPSVPVKSPFELLVLASIIEKETAVASERPRVAAVFVNRLNKNMRLQSDPTIIYGLVGGKGSLGRPILKSEISRRSPYNTYVINGLPPGPIANVGRAALEAAARPAKTDDLYFVADGTGGHAFSSSYAGHRQNVSRWRDVEKARGAVEADRVNPDDAEDIAPAEAGQAGSGRRS